LVKFAIHFMKYKVVYISLFLLLASCVSKKKYNALKQRHDQSINEKVDLETVLNKVSVENDSLKKRLVLVDSLFMAERLKNGISGNTAASSDVSVKAKTSTISKTVEYDTKALYIYNIPNYVFWPGTVKTDKFLIGIMGDSKLNAALASYMYGKNIHRMPAVVEPYTPAPGKFYHMIFVADSKQKEFSKIKKDLEKQPVLLIVENQSLEKAGGHIYVYAEGDKVKFRVNKKQIEKAGLNVSEQLVKLGQATQ
jgi:hypothetical protein